MIEIRKSEDRGRAELGWLDSRFTFSFDQYYDPRHMGFGALRAINDDRVAPSAGVPMHPHRDMEIITYMLEGSLAHRDSMGHEKTIRAGEVQRMTAGSGILHSEFNPSADEPARLLQIWIRPRARGLAPGYEQRFFDDAGKRGRLRLIASGNGGEDSMSIEQDADVYASILEPAQAVTHPLAPGRRAWLQVARGSLRLNGIDLREGDGAAVEEEESLRIEALESAEFVLFDLA